MKNMKQTHYILAIFLVLLLSSTSKANDLNLSPIEKDSRYMQIALEDAKANPRAPFAAIIVDNKTGEILCKGLNAAKHNPTLHGEMVAINNCSSKHPGINWSETTLYTTTESCTMCQSAIVWAKISRTVFGSSIEYLKKCGWSQIDIDSQFVVSRSPFYQGTITGGVLADRTNSLFCPRQNIP